MVLKVACSMQLPSYSDVRPKKGKDSSKNKWPALIYASGTSILTFMTEIKNSCRGEMEGRQHFCRNKYARFGHHGT